MRTKMMLKEIKEITIQGITLLDAVYVSSTGRVVATSRVNKNNGLVVGHNYYGILSYDADNNRVFKAVRGA